MRAVEALVLAVTRLTLEERVIAPLPDEGLTSASSEVVVDVEVEEELMRQFEREVPSLEIGIRIAQQLKSVDQIVYIRYASEYFNFQDLEDLSREVSGLQEEPPVIPTQSDMFNK